MTDSERHNREAEWQVICSKLQNQFAEAQEELKHFGDLIVEVLRRQEETPDDLADELWVTGWLDRARQALTPTTQEVHHD